MRRCILRTRSEHSLTERRAIQEEMVYTHLRVIVAKVFKPSWQQEQALEEGTLGVWKRASECPPHTCLTLRSRLPPRVTLAQQGFPASLKTRTKVAGYARRRFFGPRNSAELNSLLLN